MQKKVDQRVSDRIRQLRFDYHLSIEVIAERLGLSARTVKYYLRAFRTNTRPYHPDQALHVSRDLGS